MSSGSYEIDEPICHRPSRQYTYRETVPYSLSVLGVGQFLVGKWRSSSPRNMIGRSQTPGIVAPCVFFRNPGRGFVKSRLESGNSPIKKNSWKIHLRSWSCKVHEKKKNEEKSMRIYFTTSLVLSSTVLRVSCTSKIVVLLIPTKTYIVRVLIIIK